MPANKQHFIETNKKCKLNDCDNWYFARGLCNKHYSQVRAGKLPESLLEDSRNNKPKPPEFCTIENCNRKHFASGLCRTHHRWKKQGKDMTGAPRVFKYEIQCIVVGCEDQAKSAMMCYRHYHNPEAAGQKEDPIHLHIDRSGYIVLQGKHPANPYPHREYEHRIIMEKIIGRQLKKKENVHHENGDRADNRPENLELWSSSQPPGQRVEDKMKWVYEMLDQYGDEWPRDFFYD